MASSGLVDYNYDDDSDSGNDGPYTDCLGIKNSRYDEFDSDSTDSSIHLDDANVNCELQNASHPSQLLLNLESTSIISRPQSYEGLPMEGGMRETLGSGSANSERCEVPSPPAVITNRAPFTASFPDNATAEPSGVSDEDVSQERPSDSTFENSEMRTLVTCEAKQILPSQQKKSKRRRKKYALPYTELPQSMKEFLREVKLFFTRAINLQRQKPPICSSTYSKAEERLLCYLGYARNNLGLKVTPELFLRLRVVEKYLTFLKETRGCSSSTMANHAASLIYPVKFIHCDKSPSYDGVDVIKQLRAQVACLQRTAGQERPSTKEDLELDNRWLEWDQIVESVSLQRERFEMARSMASKARECSDLLLLSLYVLIPPGRGQEIRTLELLPNDSSLNSPELINNNVVELKGDGSVTLRFQEYKTKKFRGTDTTLLQAQHELSRVLKEYVEKYRASLVSESSGNFLLLNANGARFTSAAFSAHLKYLFLRLTGVKVSINILRSSFLTWAYGRSDCTDSMKESLAAALRHTRKQAQSTYDRRTANQKKEKAFELASDFAQSCLSTADNHSDDLKIGDFMGLVEENSSVSEPKILLGRVHALLADNRVSLLWYAPVSIKTSVKVQVYAFHMDSTPWIESRDSLVPVTAKEVRNSPGMFKLVTSLKKIHKAVQSDN